MFIVLAAIIALGAGGWFYLKPVRDVASMTHQAIGSVKEQAGNVVSSLSVIWSSLLLVNTLGADTERIRVNIPNISVDLQKQFFLLLHLRSTTT